MFKSTFNYWQEKIDSIIPQKYNIYIFLGAFIIIVLTQILNAPDNEKLDQEFYKFELVDRINEINHKENGFNYKIGASWYLIKHPLVNHMSVGDSIFKDSNSFYLVVRNNNIVIWDSEVRKNIIFRRVSLG